MKYKLRNGYTKKEMIQFIRDYNTGERCHNGFSCVYSDRLGNHCAIGCFIPDDHKGMWFAGEVRDLLKEYPDLQGVMPLSLRGLEKMQEVHDYHSKDSPQPIPKKYKDIDNVRKRLITWIENNVE